MRRRLTQLKPPKKDTQSTLLEMDFIAELETPELSISVDVKKNIGHIILG